MKGFGLGQDQTGELKAALRQRFTAFDDSNDRQNRVTAVDSIVDHADKLLAQDAEIPEREQQRQRAAIQQAFTDGQGIVSFGAGLCVLAVLIVLATVIWGSTPFWTLFIGVPVLLGLAGFVVTCSDTVAEHTIVKDPQGHIAVCWMLAGLTAATGLMFVLAALVWPTSSASWIALAAVAVPTVITVQARRPSSHEQSYRSAVPS